MLKGKGSKMTVSIWGLIGILVITAWLFVSVMQSHEAYAERKKVSGTIKSCTHLAYDYPEDTRFRVDLWVLSSADPDWNNALVFDVRCELPTPHNLWWGYRAITHPGGDQTFVKYEAPMEQLGGPDIIYRIEGSYMGGTGKFKGIGGSITIKEKRTVVEGITAEWETEYEVK